MKCRWSDLLGKYLEKDITDIELKELYRQAALSKAKQAQLEDFATKKGIINQLKGLEGIDPAEHYETFKNRLEKVRQRQVYRNRTMAAALLIFPLSIFVLQMLFRQTHSISKDQPPFSFQNSSITKEPVLLTSNGDTIRLDSVPEGEFIAPGVPFKKKGSALLYAQTELGNRTQTQGINILSIPPGRQYQITLADNSVILLNAMSKLHFPDTFSSNERWVALEGEAWFEVNANPSKPFIVNVTNQIITKATGTSFNIKGYDKDNINTTLFKGKLTVTHLSDDNSAFLHAGQQASFKNGILATTATPKMDQVIAWKSNEFIFDDSMDEIMQEIGRWYNVKIKYEDKVPATKLMGAISRSYSLSSVIELLSELRVVQITQIKDTLIVSSPQY